MHLKLLTKTCIEKHGKHQYLKMKDGQQYEMTTIKQTSHNPPLAELAISRSRNSSSTRSLRNSPVHPIKLAKLDLSSFRNGWAHIVKTRIEVTRKKLQQLLPQNNLNLHVTYDYGHKSMTMTKFGKRSYEHGAQKVLNRSGSRGTQ